MNHCWFHSLLCFSCFAYASVPAITDINYVGNSNAQGVLQIGFDIFRGNSILDTGISRKPHLRKPHLRKRSNIAGTLNSTILNEQNFYLANVTVGTPAQSLAVLIDTGSSDLWVMGNQNPYCEPSSTSSVSASATNAYSSAEATIDCSLYGTFDKSKSSTYKSNGTTFYIEYGDGSTAQGTWGTDEFTIAGITIHNQSLAVANKTDASISILGIGYVGLESTEQSTTTEDYTYPNLPVKLVEQGIINKNAYSLYLNTPDSSSGIILFGGVDHDKYTGSLETVQVVNQYLYEGVLQPITLAVTLSAITVNSTVVSNLPAVALLDSGTTAIYAPVTVFMAINQALGGTYNSEYGVYTSECVKEDDTTQATFDFTGAKINVSLYDLQVPISELTTGTSSSRKGTCVIEIFASSDSSYILGDAFLRSAYVVYDLDDYQISLAQSNPNSTSENIEVIKSSVPSATSASDYSATWTTTSGSTSATKHAIIPHEALPSKLPKLIARDSGVGKLEANTAKIILIFIITIIMSLILL